MKTQIELSKGCPVHLAIAEFLAADARVLEVASPDPTAPPSLEYMQRCNERARAVRVLMNRLPMVSQEYSTNRMAAADAVAVVVAGEATR